MRCGRQCSWIVATNLGVSCVTRVSGLVEPLKILAFGLVTHRWPTRTSRCINAIWCFALLLPVVPVVPVGILAIIYGAGSFFDQGGVGCDLVPK